MAMLSRSFTRSLRALEGQSLHGPVVRRQQCVRCLHASIRRRADEAKPASPKDKEGTQVNTPKKGRGRKQKAAELSEEVQKLADSGPSEPSAAPLGNTTQATPSTNVVEDISSSEQGDLVAQAVKEPATTSRAQEQVNAKKSVGRANQVEKVQRDRAERTATTEMAPSEVVGAMTQELSSEAPDQLVPQHTVEKELLSGRMAGLLFKHNIDEAVASQMYHTIGPGSLTLGASDILQKLGKGHKRLHAFNSEQQLQATQEEHGMKSLSTKAGETHRKEPKSWKKKGPGVSGLTAKTQETIIRRFVKGEYGNVHLMFGKEEHPVSTINTINRQLNKNPTFTSRDGQRVREKVLALLPKAPAPRKAEAKA